MTNISLRKTLFGLTGAALIALFVLIGRSPAVYAALKEGQKFEDWAVACELDANKKQSCFLVQALNSTEGDKTQQIAQYRIGYFGTKTIKMVQILPFGVALQPGTSIISGEKIIAPGKFTTCQPVGCIAALDLSKGDLDSIIANDQNFVGMISIEGKQMNVPLSNKGLKEGIASMK